MTDYNDGRSNPVPTLVDLPFQIVSSHAKKTFMTTEQLEEDMNHIHAALLMMQEDKTPEHTAEQPPEESQLATSLNIKQAFKKNKVI